MSVSGVQKLNKKLDGLPEDLRERVAGYISDHFEEIKDELRWDESFTRTSARLSEFARKAREQIKAGKAEELDFSKL